MAQFANPLRQAVKGGLRTLISVIPAKAGISLILTNAKEEGSQLSLG
ncbi:MAG: hypothetical protein QM605_09185 [Sphingobium sp.]